ncbi:spore germination protein [Paenibacillus sp. LHD-38]|uniref:spore germination protein n=1 Tax=Paenibacillus sp. LHD-38 TaxID=3072143 RepID=UPI00280CD2E1|nr:spore germination protein [Paenibacillus sp. LHD-38]MDQ8734696.1 spore germination protein [Paenibacillus sp. LHD-38]
MDSLLKELEDKLGANDDFFIQPDKIGGASVVLMGFVTLIDLMRTKIAIHKNFENTSKGSESIVSIMAEIGEIREIDLHEAISLFMGGKLIVYFESEAAFVIVDPFPIVLNRSVESPTNENVLQGPMSSFIEDIDTNIGIVRKQIISHHIKVKSFLAGTRQQKKISLIYDDSHADPGLVSKIMEQLERSSDKEIDNIQNLSTSLGLSSWSAVPKFNTTELPQEVASALKKGRVVLFIDRLPFALVLPNLIWDMFSLENDHNFPRPLMVIIRLLRVIGVLITLLAPGLYVALVAVNPEVLRIELALTIAQSREGVPYPAIVEIILMLVILELIIEASTRLPKSIGPTITMVGGIILGQAVVAARLVSNLLIIVLAATTISNSTVVGFQNSLTIRVFKYLIVIMSAIFGILGLLAGMVLLCGYLASIKTFGISYLDFSMKKGETENG